MVGNEPGTYGGELILNRHEARLCGYSEGEIGQAEKDHYGRIMRDGRVKAYLNKPMATNWTPPRPSSLNLNRAQRRAAERGRLPCRKCGIQYRNRFEEWSACTVSAPPALVALGHDFI